MSNQQGKEAEARADDRAVESFMKLRHPAEMASVEIAEGMGLPPGRVWDALNRLSSSAITKLAGHRWTATRGGQKG